MTSKDEFDDEGFLESLWNRKGKADLPPGLRRLFIVIAVLVLASILILVVAKSWPSSGNANEGSGVPIIQADQAPYKVKPDNPGGMDVPNKNSTIFETLKGDNEQSKTENLLEDPSDTANSVAREQVAAKVDASPKPIVDVKLEKTGAPPDENLESPLSQTNAVAPASAPKALPPTIVAATQAPTPKASASIIDSIKQDAHAADAKVFKPTVAVKKTVAKPIIPGGSTFIQLAAVKSQAEVGSQWLKIKAKNPELSALSMRSQKAYLGAKGIFYRIQAGPVSPGDASKTCSAIKSRGGSCIVAK